MGKSKFTPEIADKICELHSKGLPIKYCAEAVGIRRDTVYRWMRKGEQAKSGKFHEFYKNMKMARADFIAYHHMKVAEDKDWRSSQYLLQCVAPADYVVEERTRVSADVKNGDSQLEKFNKIMDRSK